MLISAIRHDGNGAKATVCQSEESARQLLVRLILKRFPFRLLFQQPRRSELNLVFGTVARDGDGTKTIFFTALARELKLRSGNIMSSGSRLSVFDPHGRKNQIASCAIR